MQSEALLPKMYVILGVLGLTQLCKTLFKVNDRLPVHNLYIGRLSTITCPQCHYPCWTGTRSTVEL